ncbi:MAG: hypothetical protein OEW62_09420 [Candidatus Bathyarchaeota archaeon]|nr:hypothetical protein [Candidatus Bathyarchaeota archaeon]
MFVTTTTKPFKSSSPIGLSDYYFFCGFNIYLLLEGPHDSELNTLLRQQKTLEDVKN